MSDPNCLFCKIAAGDIPADEVHRDHAVVAFRDISPQAPLHVLVIPVEHLVNAGEVVDHDPALLARMVSTARDLARAEGVADDGYRIVMNTGAGAGQSVFHAHLHLLGGRTFSWPPG